MAYILYMCIFVYFGVFVESTRSISGLYCSDPDTGKLYEVNSTWPSETFCGNYTCKLTKRNVTETGYRPIVKINITDIQLPMYESIDLSSLPQAQKESNFVTKSKKLEDIQNDMTISPSGVSTIMVKPDNSDSFINKNKSRDINQSSSKETKQMPKDDKDRYLTEEEIKVITEILHTIKKSDLEAIIDVYNLAQEIYSEMENATGKNNNEPVNINSNLNTTKVMHQKSSKPSFWYSSLNKDMKTESTVAFPIPQNLEYPSFYRAPYSGKDFGKLIYYYPLSEFQRMSSYVNPKPLQVKEHKGKPCKSKASATTTPNYNKLPKHTKSSGSIDKNLYQTMLQYPFSYVHRYNMKDHPNSYYYYYYPWAQLDVYNKNRNYIDPYLSTYSPQSYKTDSKQSKKDKSEDKKSSKVDKAADKKEEIKKESKKLPKWQTDPLSPKVIEEVKANVLDKTKLINPFTRKGAKLERIGKLIKLDALNRDKRQIKNENGQSANNYEARVEKIECNSGTELGYFSYGNETAPYPACCPQKIIKDV